MFQDNLTKIKTKADMTARQAIKNIPTNWRDTEIAIENSIGDAQEVTRIALHKNGDSRRAVVLHVENIKVKPASKP